MQRRTELYVVGGVAVLLILVGIAAALLGAGAPPPSFTATQTSAVTATDWARGNTSNPKATVIEYGDFECPACGQYEPIVEQLTQDFGSQVEFVFRNFPLFQIHPNAMIAAQAAEAAGVQGKYWEMHDLLYSKQSEWANESTSDVVSKFFDGYAQSLGLNVSKFNTDINSDAVKNKVQKDLDTGNAASIDHTPTFFINLTQIQNPNGYADFKTDIDAALSGKAAPTSNSVGNVDVAVIHVSDHAPRGGHG